MRIKTSTPSIPHSSLHPPSLYPTNHSRVSTTLIIMTRGKNNARNKANKIVVVGVPKQRRMFSSLIFAILAVVFFIGMECDCFSLILASFNRNPAYYGSSNKCSSFLFSLNGNDIDNDDGVGDDVSDDTKPVTKSLLEMLSPPSSCTVNQMSGTELAYIGDVVFELFVRSRHVWPSKRTTDLQNLVVGLVRAENQSHLLKKLKETFPLSDKESQVLSRGRNSVTRSKNRRNPAAYQDSTSLEALVGYVYINDPNRCQELLAWFETVIDEPME